RPGPGRHREVAGPRQPRRARVPRGGRVTTAATVQPRPDLADPALWSFPELSTDQLGDGLTVHQLHLPGRGLVAIDLRVDAPIALDPAGREGLALLTSRALDEGSRQRDGDAFAAALDRVGADLHTGA